MKMHQLPVDNFIVYYLVVDEKRTVTVARNYYSEGNLLTGSKRVDPQASS